MKLLENLRNNFDIVVIMIYAFALGYVMKEMLLFSSTNNPIGVLIMGFLGLFLWNMINNWIISLKSTRNMKYINSQMKSNFDYHDERLDDLIEAIAKIGKKKNGKK